MKKFAVAISQKSNGKESLACIIIGANNKQEALGRAIETINFDNFCHTAYQITEVIL